MTETLWLTIGAATLVAVVLPAVSLLGSTRGARRIDRLVAERATADRQRRESDAEGERLIKAGLVDTRR